MKKVRIIALLLVLTMVFGLICGCGKTETADEETTKEAVSDAPAKAEAEKPVESSPAPDESEAAPAAEEASVSTAWTDDPFMSRFEDPGKGCYTLPLAEEPTVFTYFQSMNPQMADLIDEVGNTKVDQWYRDVTNIKFDYTTYHPSAQQEQFNLMLTSGDWCDTFSRAATLYAGGYVAMLNDGIIWDLAPMIEKYAPNYSEILSSDQNIRNAGILPDGQIPAFCNLYSPDTSVGMGMMLRKDWVDELGIEMPQTIDEYYEYIKACKSKYNATMWLPANGMWFCYEWSSAFGVAIEATTGMATELNCWTVDDGVVNSSLADKEGFLSYVGLMHDWYAEGIIFSDFMSGDVSNTFCNNSGNNVDRLYSGEFCIWESMTENFVDYQDKFGAGIVSAAYTPVQNKGDKVDIGYYYCRMNSFANSIASTCPEEKAELLVKWFDLHYSDLGSFVGLWGMEGVTFEFDENDTPHYNDFVMNNPDGLSTRQVLAVYGGGGSMYYRLQDYYAETYPEDGIKAEEIWTYNYTQSRTYPTIVVQWNDEESDVLSAYLGQIITYLTETITRAIIGDIDMEAYYDEFLETLYELGLQEMWDAYQSAYDRYLVA